MSSGRDVYLENLAKNDKPYYTIPELNEKFGKDTGNKLDTPQLVTYYCRVNGDKITWGYMKQLDDNLVITYNKDNKTFTIDKI